MPFNSISRMAMDEETKYTWEEIRVFLHNAELATSEGVSDDPRRQKLLRALKALFHEELEHWHNEPGGPHLGLTWPETVFVFASLAHEFHLNAKGKGFYET